MREASVHASGWRRSFRGEDWSAQCMDVEFLTRDGADRRSEEAEPPLRRQSGGTSPGGARCVRGLRLTAGEHPPHQGGSSLLFPAVPFRAPRRTGSVKTRIGGAARAFGPSQGIPPGGPEWLFPSHGQPTYENRRSPRHRDMWHPYHSYGTDSEKAVNTCRCTPHPRARSWSYLPPAHRR